MLPEPEMTLVARYLDCGGAIKEIPFGVSGASWSFGKTARQSGSWGAVRRYGGLHIEAAAMPHIAAGELTVAQARVGFVWTLLRRNGPMTVTELVLALRLSDRTLRATTRALIALGAAQMLMADGPRKLAALERPRAPHWRDFLETAGESRAA